MDKFGNWLGVNCLYPKKGEFSAKILQASLLGQGRMRSLNHPKKDFKQATKALFMKYTVIPVFSSFSSFFFYLYFYIF